MQTDGGRKMKVKRRPAIFLAVVFLIAFLAAGLTGCGSDNSSASGSQSSSASDDSNTLRVGVRYNISRFGYLNEDNGRYSGLEINIADTLAERLGYKNIEYVAVTPDNRQNMLLSGDIDCLIACFSITETRSELFDFSLPYYTDYSIILVEDSSLFTDIDDMQGCSFGVMSGGNTEVQLTNKMEEIGFSDGEVISSNEDDSVVDYTNYTVVSMPSYRELSDALEAGSIDAICMDGCFSYTYMTSDRHILEDFNVAEQDYAVATLKDSALSAPIGETIQSMLDDGTIAKIIDKWD